MCCRSVERAETAKMDVLARSKANANHVFVVQLDLADLDNVGEFRAKYDAIPELSGKPIDMLILNAGIMAPAKLQLTKQGIESQMGTNVVGHYKFAYEMIDKCVKAEHSRVVIVSSLMHRGPSSINLQDFGHTKRYRKWTVYQESKLADLLLMFKLNAFLEAKHIDNVTVVACHPGYASTNLQNGTGFKFANVLFAQSQEAGAEPTVLAATDLAAKRNSYAGPTGFIEAYGTAAWGRKINSVAKKTELQDTLYAKLVELTGVDFNAKEQDLLNKVAVITGANSGIGLEAAVKLAARGSIVVMCCRSVERAETAKMDVLARSKADASHVFVLQLDLADLDNVSEFRAKYDATPELSGKPIDMLILNAGIMAPATLQLTKQGIESQMGTNVVGHYKFACEMIDKCVEAEHGRVVIVSSVMHRVPSSVNLQDFGHKSNYGRWIVYQESKLADLLLMFKLNAFLEAKQVDNVTVVACHPGYASTNLQDGTVFKFANALFAQSQEAGAEPTVLAATDLAAKRNSYAGPTGFIEAYGTAAWGRKINSVAKKTELQDALYAKLVELTGVDFNTKV
ncbi:hypothetical protein BASA81_000842 [Batrachochytrium salamandrivorans]|nr:hypothetical protein BASA81_000842 [Batrachochytrium salamandrivorans]